MADTYKYNSFVLLAATTVFLGLLHFTSGETAVVDSFSLVLVFTRDHATTEHLNADITGCKSHHLHQHDVATYIHIFLLTSALINQCSALHERNSLTQLNKDTRGWKKLATKSSKPMKAVKYDEHLKRRPTGLKRRPTGLKRRPTSLKRRPTGRKSFFLKSLNRTFYTIGFYLRYAI